MEFSDLLVSGNHKLRLLHSFTILIIAYFTDHKLIKLQLIHFLATSKFQHIKRLRPEVN